MKRKKRAGPAAKSESTASIRATISFPHELYKTLDEIARQKKVSLAWVVREATERYIADKWPLLAGLHHD
jgi:metal-responsive CopG/Arc/MetJ family transcriptional regulator